MYLIYFIRKFIVTTHRLHQKPEPWDTKPHVANFLKAVRSRKREDLTCDILEGHLSAALCHMANISYRTGRTLAFNAEAENFGSDYASPANPWSASASPADVMSGIILRL
jgi:hypothetical protein